MLIRFNCPHCGRRYELSPVMARLPLLCKGCGQSFVVPEASTVEPALPPPPPPPPVAPPLKKYIPPPPEPEDEPEPEPEVSPVVPQPKAEKPRPKVKPQPPPPPSEDDEPAPAPGRKNLLPVVADVAVGLILLAVGVFLGELLAQKSTGQILHEAGTAMKFPPIELIQWMGPPVVIVLTYALLASKGRGVGGWIRRRMATSLLR